MNLKQIEQKIDEARTLQFLTEALSEISSVRLKKIRNGVERNIYFFNELSQVYRTVKFVADRKGIKLDKNNKQLIILLTSNFRFYGDLNTKLLKFFLPEIGNSTTDIVVVGKIGIEYLQGINFKKPFTPLIFEHDMPSDEEFKKLADYVNKYSQVFIYYSKFKNVLNQPPIKKDLTQSSDTSYQLSDKSDDQKLKIEDSFIFEPEIHKILNFFDDQLKSLLLEETFLETELSRVSARLVATSSAEKAAEDYLDKEEATYANAKRSVYNTQILESLAGFEALKIKLKTRGG